MRKNGPMVNRWLYGLMCLLLVLNYGTPLMALAEDVNSDGQLTLGEVKQTSQQEMTLALQGKAQPVTQEVVVHYSANVSIKAAHWAAPNNTRKIQVDDQKKQIQIELNQQALADTLVLTLNPTATEDVTFSYGQQQRALTLNTGTDPTESTAITSSPAASANEGSTEEASTNSSVPRSSEETVASTTKAIESKTTESTTVKPRVAGPTDISDYFTGDETTIIDNFEDPIYLNPDGTPATPPYKEDVTIHWNFNWSIPEDVREQMKAGDYFEFQLPGNLKPNKPGSGDLVDAEGNVYGTYTISEDGTVRFTFNERITSESDIHGDFSLDTHLNDSDGRGPGDWVIDIPTQEDLPPVVIPIVPDTEQQIDKQGHFDRTPNPSAITWTVDINQAMKDQTNPTVTETWPTGNTFKSVKVYELVMNLDGTIKEVGRELSPDEYTVDKNGNVTIKGDTNKAYRLEYQTTIDESVIPDGGGDVPFKNHATLTSDNNPNGLDAEATVTATYGKMLDKRNIDYDEANQEFTWEINYNYGEQTIPKDQAVITDTMGDNLTFEPDSLHLYSVTFDDKGNEVVGAELVEGKDYKVVIKGDGSFAIDFLHDVNGAVKIDYKTKVDGIVEGDVAVNNRVDVGTGQHSEGDGTASQQNIIKNTGAVDYQNSTIGWTLAVNQNNYLMENAVITDTYEPVPGLTMVPNSLVVKDTTTGAQLTLGKDFMVEITRNAEGETGFKVSFIGAYAKTSDAFHITYTTFFDVTELDANNPALDHYRNTAAIDWTDEAGNNHHSEDSKPFKPLPAFDLNAQKSGVYNAVTKEITWTLAVNLSNNRLVDAFLTDPILANQTYLAGSLKVYEGNTKPDGSVEKVKPAQPLTDITMEEPSEKNQNTWRVDFPNDSRTYVIEFKTSVDEKVIEGSASYDNTASYTNQGSSRDVTGKVSIQHGGESVKKGGEYHKDDPDHVYWHVMINGAQSVLDDVVITDTPSPNQVLDPESLVIYGTNVTEDGTITPDKSVILEEGKDYTLEVTTDNETGQQKIVVKMAHIEAPYYMEYRSLVTSSAAGSTDTVSNQVSITGNGSEVVHGDDNGDVVVDIDHSGGHATGTKGKIQLKKTAMDGTTILAGAHFQIWDQAKTQVLREGTVDATGVITFGGLPQGQYILVETKAPEGYTVSDELAKGQVITIDEETSADGAQPTIIKNNVNKVILEKTDEKGKKLVNARFKLEHAVTTPFTHWEEVPLAPDRTNANGQLEVDSLKPGLYQFTEIEAPTGYLLDTTPKRFIVTQNTSGQIRDVHVKMLNYQGSAELIKKDQAGNPLAGAEFSVLDTTGQAVREHLVSDANGKVTVTDLAPGKYQFVETKAPAGYLLNTEPSAFTIAASDRGKPATVIATANFVNYQGAAKLIKKDVNGHLLSGATFKVLDAKGQTIQTGLTTNSQGKIIAEHLAPGKYRFVETKAPTGYLLNTMPVPFEIAEKNAGKPAVVVASDNFVNYKGAFQIVKTNSADQPLAGAVFELYDHNKQSLGITATSGKDGKIIFRDLAPGTYYYKEIKAPKLPDGADYIIYPELVKVEIRGDFKGDPEIFQLGAFANFKGRAVFKKIDANANPLPGTIFKLYRIENGEKIFEREVTSEKDGSLAMEDLGAGSYELDEMDATDGYIVNKQPIYFVVKKNSNDKQPLDELEFVNYQAEVTGRKVNEQGQTLAGAVFAIYNADNQNQPQGSPITFLNRAGEKVSEITTDKTGEIYAKGLNEGHYVLVETKAPTGYLLDTTPHPFDVTAQLGKEQPIALGDLINYQGTAQLTKENETGEALAGAVFKVIDETGQTVAGQTNLMSDKQGKVIAKNLAPGTYRFVETQAPTGYLLNETPSASFTIAKDNQGKPATVVLKAPDGYQLSKQAVAFTIAATAKDKPELVDAGTFVNEKQPVSKKTKPNQPTTKQAARETGWLGLPKTNTQVNYFFVFIGLLLVGLASWLFYKKSKK
ncbi:LPXTG-domain-containing protein cell wall anchor domain [Enterococcus faecalis EnGen0234]|uniref:fibrinogen-binding MSCRAMM adhesin Fss1 n=1 Tax=Enterococcus faecalis TaxID=1351 RepID=UPI00032DE883|nr:fibrinogen-binding MSCRAMM adhesin Fss1 [Enterococcus faecalis]EOM01736.1 LPXTG-domain-containing protein cell wall anchor domain [Enterococcus faecalis EnGen0233]EOM12901.1 LPXTG-domain-containing protein cell wall anchor domain [Enterococcus faecalis EnGen0234]